MILTSSIRAALAIAASPIYVAELGSSVPHSVCIDGQVYQLMDPPELPEPAGLKPFFFIS